MCTYVYVCMCMCMYVYVCVYVYIYMIYIKMYVVFYITAIDSQSIICVLDYDRVDFMHCELYMICINNVLYVVFLFM